RGDLHVHTTWSDGKASVLEMALAARDLGYEYVAICDHTPNVRVVPGLDADDLRRQAEEIVRVEPRNHAHVRRVVADRDVLVAEVARGERHLEHRGLAVRPGRVHVQ